MRGARGLQGLRQPLRRGNLFATLPRRQDEEQVDLLVGQAGLRIERIVSTGQSSPPGFWYDQPEDEFVVLLAGAARLRFDDGDVSIDMKPGDWVEIPAHVRHRVEAMQADLPTVWLAVFHSHVPLPQGGEELEDEGEGREGINAALAGRGPSARRSAGRRASSGGDSGP